MGERCGAINLWGNKIHQSKYLSKKWWINGVGKVYTFTRAEKKHMPGEDSK